MPASVVATSGHAPGVMATSVVAARVVSALMAAARMVARATTPGEGGAEVVAAMKTATMTTTATRVVG